MSPRKLSADINRSCDLITDPLKLTQNTEHREIDALCIACTSFLVFPFSPQVNCVLSIDGWNFISRAGTDQLQHSKTDPLKISRKNSTECGPDLDTVILEYLEEINLVCIPVQATLPIKHYFV